MRLRLAIFALLCSVLCHVQHAKMLTTDDGLAGNYVRSVAVDGSGCVWVATRSGLSRYDGVGFTNYTSRSSALAGDMLNVVYYDDVADRLWVGHHAEGLNSVDCHTLSMTEHHHDSVPLHSIVDISKGEGCLWLTDYMGRIVRYDRHTDSFCVLVEGLPDSWCSIDDGQGHLLVGHVLRGLTLIDINTRKATALHLPAEAKGVRCMLRSADGRLWLGTNRGLMRYDVQTHRITTVNSGIEGAVLAMTETSDGKLWLCGKDGQVVSASGQRLALDSKTEAGGIVCYSYNNLWIALWGDGIAVGQHITPAFSHSMQGCKIGAMLQDGNGRLLATEGGTLYADGEVLAHVGKLPITALGEADDGSTLIGVAGANYIIRYDGHLKQLPLVELKRNTTVNCFLAQANGTLIGTLDGIYSMQHGLPVLDSTLTRLLPDVMVQAMTVDTKGRLWIGTYGGSIVVVEDGKRVAKLGGDEGFYVDCVSCLLCDAQGKIWVGTGKGLVCVQSDFSYDIYNNQDDLRDPYVNSLCLDAKGRLWLSLTDGIAMFDTVQHRFNIYDRHDGMRGRGFQPRAVCRTAQDDICMGTLDGICRFSPLLLKRGATVSPTLIRSVTDLSRNQRLVAHEGCYTLPQSAGAVAITFAVADYAQAATAQFQYRLSSDTLWHEVGEGQQRLVLHNLPAGRHTITVRARLGGHSDTYGPEDSVVIVVQQSSWWLTIGVIALALLAVGGAWRMAARRNRRSASVACTPAFLQQAAMSTTSVPDAAAQREAEFIARLDSVLAANIANPDLGLPFLTEQIAMSHSTLYRRVKQYTGMNVNEYVRSYRLRMAKEMIEQGRLSTKQVAHCCGFNDVDYFRTCYKQAYGTTPPKQGA